MLYFLYVSQIIFFQTAIFFCTEDIFHHSKFYIYTEAELIFMESFISCLDFLSLDYKYIL